MIPTVKIEKGEGEDREGEIRYHMSFRQEHTRDSKSGASYDVQLASTANESKCVSALTIQACSYVRN